MNNPKIVARPLGDKVSFLKKKGLTEEEISTVCQRANLTSSHGTPKQMMVPMPMAVYGPWAIFWNRLRNVVNLAVFLTGSACAIYYFWKV